MDGLMPQDSDWDIAGQYGCAHGATGPFRRLVLHVFDPDDTAINVVRVVNSRTSGRTSFDTAISHIRTQVVVRHRREFRELNGVKLAGSPE